VRRLVIPDRRLDLAKEFFDAVYQYPGGWLADRVGRRAFLVFIALASAGYFVYLGSPVWPYVFLGLALSISWASMASRTGSLGTRGSVVTHERPFVVPSVISPE
jgi:MFS family permease